MKEKIIAELKKKYSGQLTVKFIESLADRLLASVKEESEIQGAIKELENSHIKITDIQAEGDRRATELQIKIKTLETELDELKKKPGNENPGKSGNEGDDNSVLEEIRALKKELNDFRRADKIKEVRAILYERAKEKKIPKILLESATIENEGDIEKVLTSLEEKTKSLRQELHNQGVVDGSPLSGEGEGTTQEEIKSYIESNPVVKSKKK